MGIRTALTAASVSVILLLMVTVACQSGPVGQGPFSEAVTTTQPVTPQATPSRGAVVTGTISPPDSMALRPDLSVEFKLLDVSMLDAPAVTIAEQVLHNPGQGPIQFEIAYDPAAIHESNSYAVQVRVLQGDELAYISDTAYPVITGGHPTHVDVTLVEVE